MDYSAVSVLVKHLRPTYSISANMCNITKLFLVMCVSLAVLQAVDGYSFRPNSSNSTRIRREAEAQGNGNKGKGKGKGCANSFDFRCKSGECIKEDQECDGTIDCQDASDESNACHRIKCPEYLFRCKYGACINADFKCNGRTDCKDNSDETSPDCKDTAPVEQCNNGQFRCNSGQCIKEDLKCDGKKDCQDASDETSAVCYGTSCPGFTYKCKYGACVDGNAECNGQVECFDGSDEDPDICKTPVTPTQSPIIITPKPVTEGPGPGPDPGLGPSPGGEGPCTLPNYPDYGKWVIVGTTLSYTPGMKVETGTVLQLSCHDSYKLDGDSLVLCNEGGQWSSQIGTCSKTCPPIFTTTTTKVICTYKNQETVNCTDALDGTLAKFQCAHFYEDLGLSNKPVLLCRDGTWDQRKPECTPVCGRKSVSSTPLIVNGTLVKKGDYPWQVALYTANDKQLICGGSLINQRMIITAAHCITDSKGNKKSKELYIVAVGKYYRPYNDTRDANEAQFSSIQEMFIPEQYRGSTQNYLGDIAILVSTITFTLSEKVQPVCVDWGSNYASELSSPIENKYGFVTGWGFTSENSNPSGELKELKVPAVTYEMCNQQLPEDYNVFLTYDKLCAGYIDQGRAVCRGDSGGGLVFKHRNKYYLTGIVSLSPQAPTGGCNSQQYGLYTSVYKYLDSFILPKESQYKPRV